MKKIEINVDKITVLSAAKLTFTVLLGYKIGARIANKADTVVAFIDATASTFFDKVMHSIEIYKSKDYKKELDEKIDSTAEKVSKKIDEMFDELKEGETES